MDLVAFQQMFPPPDNAKIIERLRQPSRPVDVILDTDAYNEIDDQYALAYLVRSDDRLKIKAITAAPFYREPAPGKIIRSSSPADGMERSYQEILKVLALLDRSDLADRVYRGSDRYLTESMVPVSSEAVEQILRISQAYDHSNPLYIVAIGAVTNVASALLQDPSLRDRIVLIWLGGHAHHWSDCNEFNLQQDVSAARVVFGCGVPLVQFPCMGVVSEFRFSRPELEYWFRDKNELCNYLIDNTYEFAKKKFDYPDWSKPLWDVTTISWLLGGDTMLYRMASSPIPQADLVYGFSPDRHLIGYVYYIKKDPIIADLSQKLSK